MKKQLAILGILVAAIAVCLMLMDQHSASYSDFSSANTGMETHITGKLDHQKPITEWNDTYSFWMKDKKGSEKQVIVPGSIPQDFQRSENLVIKGYNADNNFFAVQVLIKCRSMYAGIGMNNDFNSVQ